MCESALLYKLCKMCLFHARNNKVFGKNYNHRLLLQNYFLFHIIIVKKLWLKTSMNSKPHGNNRNALADIGCELLAPHVKLGGTPFEMKAQSPTLNYSPFCSDTCNKVVISAKSHQRKNSIFISFKS